MANKQFFFTQRAWGQSHPEGTGLGSKWSVADDEGVTDWWQALEGSYEGWGDAGTHTFTWTYSKDATVSVGEDRVLLDDVAFPYWYMMPSTEHQHCFSAVFS